MTQEKTRKLKKESSLISQVTKTRLNELFTEIRNSEGLASRKTALKLIGAVIHQRLSFHKCLIATYSQETTNRLTLEDTKDRKFVRLLATTTLRRHGQLIAVVSKYLHKPLPDSGRYAQLILLLGTAQLLFLGIAPHAVINTSVNLCRMQRSSKRFSKLINAVLRRISEQDPSLLLTNTEDNLNIPKWMLKRWINTYNETTTRAIVTASLKEAALDITVLGEPKDWASKMHGTVLPTGSVRCRLGGPVNELPGFINGKWWVQDAAAAIPARLLGKIAGKRVADICAAPGGKTAQLISAKAHVTALDISETRLLSVKKNLERLRLSACSYIVGDASKWCTEIQFDAILVDVPCSATGTIRRHPDILHTKRLVDIYKLSQLQKAILQNVALNLLRPNGILVYCTCSLEPEESEEQISTFLKSHNNFERVPIRADEINGLSEILTQVGEIRTLPHHLQLDDPTLSGLDGFFVSRLRRRAFTN
ncbi:MAG TPA: Ribosomal RNA small subunit methyltransferase B [Hyphomicrobiaceae bacterium MAG_BT-2024]